MSQNDCVNKLSDGIVRITQREFLQDPRLTNEHKAILLEGFAYANEQANKGEAQTA